MVLKYNKFLKICTNFTLFKQKNIYKKQKQKNINLMVFIRYYILNLKDFNIFITELPCFDILWGILQGY